MKAFKLLKNAAELPCRRFILIHIYTNSRKSFAPQWLPPVLFNSSLIALNLGSLWMLKIVEGSRGPLKTKEIVLYKCGVVYIHALDTIRSLFYWSIHKWHSLCHHYYMCEYILGPFVPRFEGHYTCWECLSKCSLILTTAVMGDIYGIFTSF